MLSPLRLISGDLISFSTWAFSEKSRIFRVPEDYMHLQTMLYEATNKYVPLKSVMFSGFAANS
jgi:uncharacterized membrane protein YcgQ (UPF0703/DUF1980 family)